jgi:hypothetical protein
MGKWRYTLEHSEPRLEMEMRVELQASIAVLPGKAPSLPLVRGKSGCAPDAVWTL